MSVAIENVVMSQLWRYYGAILCVFSAGSESLLTAILVPCICKVRVEVIFYSIFLHFEIQCVLQNTKNVDAIIDCFVVECVYMLRASTAVYLLSRLFEDL